MQMFSKQILWQKTILDKTQLVTKYKLWWTTNHDETQNNEEEKTSGLNSNWDEKLNVRKPKCLQNTNYDKT